MKKSAEREEAANFSRVTEESGIIEAWNWSPQIGGGCGVMRVITDAQHADGSRTNDCFNVTIWHDGEFRHDGEDNDPQMKPVELHGCDPIQWLRAAAWIAMLQGMTADEVCEEVRLVMTKGTSE